MTEQEFVKQYEVGPEDFGTVGILAIIVRLFAIFNAAVERVRKARSTVSVGVKKAQEEISKDAEAVSATADVADSLRTVLFSAIQERPEISVLILDYLSDIADEVRAVRKLVMAGLDIEEEASEEDVSEEIEAAKYAAEAIRKYSTLLGMFGHTLSDLPPTMLRTNKKGEIALKAIKAPSNDEDSSSSTGAGRPVSGGKFAFALNGQPVPVSGFDRLAVFYCSTVTNRIDGPQLKDLIKRQTGKEWSDKGNESWTITVPAGTLSGTLEATK